jgi:hypothetical protein
MALFKRDVEQSWVEYYVIVGLVSMLLLLSSAVLLISML